MNDKEHRKRVERRIDAEHRLPPLKKNDSASVNIRNVLIEREFLGFEKVGDRHLASIKKRGYDAFFVDLMNSHNKIGLKLFHKLTSIGRLDLTTEYIVFHNFREMLNKDSRKKIAALLLSVSPPV